MPPSAGISPPAWGSLTVEPVTSVTPGYIPTCVGQPILQLRRQMGNTVYPHLRGAACRRCSLLQRRSGISPPAWGSQGKPREIMQAFRYIPTCVGQPGSANRRNRPPRVYPHLRGAAYPVQYQDMGRSGISPPAWGSRRTANPTPWNTRYIPTCVGQPGGLFIGFLGKQVYPHLRGAAIHPPLCYYRNKGISPPAWGSHHVGKHQHLVQGYIPTCVGQPYDA